MTKKHFKLIAAIIRRLPTDVRETAADGFARTLLETNPRFDAEKFKEACRTA